MKLEATTPTVEAMKASKKDKQGGVLSITSTQDTSKDQDYVVSDNLIAVFQVRPDDYTCLSRTSRRNDVTTDNDSCGLIVVR